MKTFYKKVLIVWIAVILGWFFIGDLIHVGDKNYTYVDYQILYDLDYPQAQLNNHSLREVFEDTSILESEQLLTNGDFSDGTTGWVITGVSVTVNNGIISATGNGTQIYVRVQQENVVSVVNGNKFYLRAKAKINNTVGNILLRAYDGTNTIVAQTISTPTADLYHDMSGVITTLATGNMNINVASFYADTSTANGKILSIDYIYAFNISTLISNKQYSPIYDTTFDLMTDAQIKAQMDEFVAKPYLFIDYETLGIDTLTVSQMDYWYSIYQTLKDLEA